MEVHSNWMKYALKEAENAFDGKVLWSTNFMNQKPEKDLITLTKILFLRMAF